VRRLPIALFAAGLILGVALPIAGFGRLPFLLGVAGLAAAGVATRRAPLALAGIAAAVVLFLVPGAVNARRNDEGIAWTAPQGERVTFTGAGLAVTESDQGRTLTARDLDSGKRRWRRRLPGEELSGGTTVWRVGETLLVLDGERALYALEADTGNPRWDLPPTRGGLTIPAVANRDLVAIARCDPDCGVEVRSLADGGVRWRRRTPGLRGPWLGSPPVAQALQLDRPLWPASAVILAMGREGERYEVRLLDSGKLVARGKLRDEALGVAGNLFLRDAGGELSATEVTTGRAVWTRKADGLRAARAPDRSLDWLAMPDGGLLMTQGIRDSEDMPVLDHLRVLDPRSGELTDHRVGDVDSGTASAVPADWPPITAETASKGVAPRVPVLWNSLDDRVAADGRVYRTGRLGPRAVAVTTTQIGWDPDVRPFAGDDRNGAEIYDRRTGERIVRFAGEHDVNVRSEGERIIVRDGQRDHVVAP
jgi:hypothetical protein